LGRAPPGIPGSERRGPFPVGAFSFRIDGARLVFRKHPQPLPVKAPDDLVGGSGRGFRVFFELHEEVVEKGALSGSVRPLKNVDPVLLGPPAEGGEVGDEPVRKKTVCEEWVVDGLNEEPPSSGLPVDGRRMSLLRTRCGFEKEISQDRPRYLLKGDSSLRAS
jgi:hypothetical protein